MAAQRPCDDVPHGCQIRDLFSLLGKTHTLDLLHVFIHEGGPHRFLELQQRLGIPPKTISARLKDLVQAGLLTRHAFNQIPPRVDYEATRKAQDLKPMFHVLEEWAGRHTLLADVAA